MLPLVPPIFGDRYSKDKSDNVTSYSCRCW
jgi:hypothetical protein